MVTRHSLKKCPEPVSAQPQRGVLTFAMELTQLDRGADNAAVA
jgi:hypothetical protein